MNSACDFLEQQIDNLSGKIFLILKVTVKTPFCEPGCSQDIIYAHTRNSLFIVKWCGSFQDELFGSFSFRQHGYIKINSVCKYTKKYILFQNVNLKNFDDRSVSMMMGQAARPPFYFCGPKR
jgi:hypothetical protein